MTGLIMAILLLWLLLPFAGIIASIIAGIVKWGGLIIVFIIDTVKDIFAK